MRATQSRRGRFRSIVLLGLSAVFVAACVQGAGPSQTAPSSPVATPRPATATVSAPSATLAATPMPDSSARLSIDPALEAMLPGEVDGVVLTRMSMPGTHSGGSGDMCFFFCPGEPEYFALALHLTSLDGTEVAVAGADQAVFPVLIYAFKVPGVRTEDLAPAWVTATYRAVADPVGGNLPTRNPSASPASTLKPLQTEQAQVGGKQVTILFDSAASPFDRKALQYLYARGDVLFMVWSPEFVFGPAATGITYEVTDAKAPPAAVVDSLAALP